MRTRARVEGVVQGVGFRPFVHRLAGELALDGFVLNDERGVQHLARVVVDQLGVHASTSSHSTW